MMLSSVAEKILDIFRWKKMPIEYNQPIGEFGYSVLTDLSLEQQESIEPAINELIRYNLIEKNNIGSNEYIRLTQKGFDYVNL